MGKKFTEEEIQLAEFYKQVSIWEWEHDEGQWED